MTNEQQNDNNEEHKAESSSRLKAQPTKKDAGGFITVIFPALNKSWDLEENNERILDEHYKQRCKVSKSVNVTSEEYEKLASSFLQYNDLWEKIGGTSVDQADVEKHLNGLRANKGLEPIEDWDSYHTKHNPVLDNYQNDHYMLMKAGYGYTNVVEVTSANKESFYVDTSGYRYARYVGMAIYDERINEDLYDAICSNDLKLVIETISKGADVNYSDPNQSKLKPLHKAVTLDHYEIAKELLKRGADSERQSKVTGKDPLCYAKSGEIKRGVDNGESKNMWRLIYRAQHSAKHNRMLETPSLLQATLSGNKELKAELLQKAASGQIIRFT